MHVHIVHQVGHLWHVLDDLVWLSGSISLLEVKITVRGCDTEGMTMKIYLSC